MLVMVLLHLGLLQSISFPLDLIKYTNRVVFIIHFLKYGRNPMISGVVCVLFGEALLFGALPLFIWALFFFTMQNVFIKFHEEPDLQVRFGQSYELYRRHVPMWIPR